MNNNHEVMPSQIRAASLILKIVGWIEIVSGILLLVIFLIIGIALGTLIESETEAPGNIFAGIFLIIGIILAILTGGIGVVSIFTARGIDNRKKWAKIVGIVLAALKLSNFPLGTALGIILIIFLVSEDAKVWFTE